MVMSVSRRTFVAASALIGVNELTVAQSSAFASRYLQMRCAASYGSTSYHTVCLRAFCEELSRETNGEVKAVVTPDQALRRMDEVLPALKTGEIEIGEVLMSSYAKDLPVLSMDTVPFIVRSWSDARKMWASSRPLVADLLSKRGALLLYAVPWPPQGLYSTTPIRKLSDLEGKKLRVFNEATWRIAELVRAVPVEVSGRELVNAIETGRVEAMLTSSTTGVDSRAWSAMKLFLDMKAWTPKNMVALSNTAWRRMSKRQRAAVDRASAHAEVAGWAMAQAADDASKKTLLEKGLRIEVPGISLRREMDLRGERFGSDWAASSTSNLKALVQYYKTLGT
jgi:TRAP-type C4-dicarboxylate transport system substrate-binding protein